MALKKGIKARLMQPTIEGEIVKVQYNEQVECLEYCLEWTDDCNGDGVPDVHRRWFLESELEEVL